MEGIEVNKVIAKLFAANTDEEFLLLFKNLSKDELFSVVSIAGNYNRIRSRLFSIAKRQPTLLQKISGTTPEEYFNEL